MFLFFQKKKNLILGLIFGFRIAWDGFLNYNHFFFKEKGEFVGNRKEKRGGRRVILVLGLGLRKGNCCDEFFRKEILFGVLFVRE